MGIFCEDPIEREHHRRKILNTLFAPMRDWERIQRHIMKRDNQMTESCVQEAMIDAIQGTKRKSLIEKNHETVKLKKLSEKEVKKSKAEELFLES
jgi:flagellar biosynthesis chaperone FliJ